MSIVFVFTSCMDITEEFTFNKDGSGMAVYTVDMSKMINMIKAMSKGDTSNPYQKSLDSMFDNLEQMKQLETISGITEVKNLSNAELGIMSYSYRFKNIESLNKALNSRDENSKYNLPTEGETLKENKFTLNNKSLVRAYKRENKKEKGDETTKKMAEMMFKDARYTTIYHFEQTIKKAKGSEVDVSDDKHTVQMRMEMLSILSGASNLSCRIKLK